MDDLEQKKRTLAPESSTVDILVGLPPKTKSEDTEAKVISIVLAPHVDDYPDGGLAAWSVVFGVRPSTGSFPINCLSRFADDIHLCRRHVQFLRRRFLSTSFI